MREPFLARVNPLAKIAAAVPAWVVLLGSRDLLTPALLAGAALLLLLVASGAPGRTLGAVLGSLVMGVPVLAAGFALWVDPGRSGDGTVVATVGPLTLTLGAAEVGLATALRLAAIVLLALVGALTTSGTRLARSLSTQLHLPYRFGYTAIAALRFVPRLAAEVALIRQAQRVRAAIPGRGPAATVRRVLAGAVPLLSAGIRHADRVALTMESRAFGAHTTRTERNPPEWRARDSIFTVAGWILTAAVAITASVVR